VRSGEGKTTSCNSCIKNKAKCETPAEGGDVQKRQKSAPGSTPMSGVGADLVGILADLVKEVRKVSSEVRKFREVWELQQYANDVAYEASEQAEEGGVEPGAEETSEESEMEVEEVELEELKAEADSVPEQAE
jgi:hypothetical protein